MKIVRLESVFTKACPLQVRQLNRMRACLEFIQYERGARIKLSIIVKLSLTAFGHYNPGELCRCPSRRRGGYMAGECPSMLSNKHRMSMTPQIGAFPFLRGTTPTNYCANPYFLTDGYEDLARDVIHQFESTTSRFHTLVDRATRVIELENISRDYNEAFEIPPLAAIDYEISCHGSGRRLVQAIPKYCATMGSLSLMFIRESLMIFGILLEEKTGNTRTIALSCWH